MSILQQVQYAAWRYGDDENGFDYYEREEDVVETEDEDMEDSDND